LAKELTHGSHAQIQASLPANAPITFETAADEDSQDQSQNQDAVHAHPALPLPPASIALTPLLGAAGDGPLLALYASQIATLVWVADGDALAVGAAKPVVVGLALRGGRDISENPVLFHGVMALVREVLGSAARSV
jgi:hypothetical protein